MKFIKFAGKHVNIDRIIYFTALYRQGDYTIVLKTDYSELTEEFSKQSDGEKRFNEFTVEINGCFQLIIKEES